MQPTKDTYKGDIYERDLRKKTCTRDQCQSNKTVVHVPVVCNCCRYYTIDLQKIPTKETSTKETYKSDLKKRPTKATLKRDIQKRPTKEKSAKETYEKDLPKRPTKKTYQCQSDHTCRTCG